MDRPSSSLVRSIWGLRLAPADAVRAKVAEHRWRGPLVAVLLATVPAFYMELVSPELSWLSTLTYLAAAAVVAAALLHVAHHLPQPLRHLRANVQDVLLCVGLVLAAVLPDSAGSKLGLSLRLAVAMLTLVRLVWALQHVITRGGLGSLLLSALGVLLLCGAGYWWLEPTTTSLGDGLWLAFVTASTVGYGDVVPTTTASKIFSFFVVLLGFGVLMVVTAAVAARWVETEERALERAVLRDMHRQMDELRAELAALRSDLGRMSGPAHPGPGGDAAASSTSPGAQDASDTPRTSEATVAPDALDTPRRP